MNFPGDGHPTTPGATRIQIAPATIKEALSIQSHGSGGVQRTLSEADSDRLDRLRGRPLAEILVAEGALPAYRIAAFEAELRSEPGAGGSVALVAAQLTSAAFMHVLSEQLRGRTVTVDEAFQEARRVWSHAAVTPTDPGPDSTMPADEGSTGPGVADLSDELPPGSMLDGRYRIVRFLGRGGFGDVYLGEEIAGGRPVALKLMRRPSDKALRYFEHEGRTLSRLKHENIAEVFHSSRIGGGYYLAMEFVEGESLRARLVREKTIAPAEAVRLLEQGCSALQCAHDLAVIHRDIKPENLMLVAGRLKLLDFGLAVLDQMDADSAITAQGNIAGTFAYMSPEQCEGARLDPRTDIYSLGVVAYEMLSGSNPFSGSSQPEIVKKKIIDPLPPLRARAPTVPASLEAAVHRALERDRACRFATAAEFAQALRPAAAR